MNYKKAHGYLTPDERQYLFEMAGECETIINIGIEYGASIHCFDEGAKVDTNIIAIDLVGADEFEGDLSCEMVYHYSEYSIAEILADGVDSIDVLLDTDGYRIIMFIKGNSNTVKINAMADCIFIDGCHWGECLENDIAKYSKLCKKYLLFHDYSDSPVHAGVKEVLDNWHCTDFEKIMQVDTIAVYKRVNA